MTTDVVAADEYSLILPETATILGVPAAVCLSLECVVPLFTFDQLIAQAIYGGPAHRYQFCLFALFAHPRLPGDPAPADVNDRIESMEVAAATVTGLFQR